MSLLSTHRILLAAICAAGILLSAVLSHAESSWPKMLLSAPSTGERSLGTAGVPVAIVEYASATCPHCAIEPRTELWKLTQRKRMQREQFDLCLTRQELSEAIYHTAKQAIEEFGLTSTPTFIINGRVVHGAQTCTFFQDQIEAELRKVGRP